MNYKRPSSYKKLADLTENYVPPVTIPLDEWSDYVEKGYNTLYNDAVVPGGTIDDGAVYSGHVRQNPWTAGDV